MCGVGAADARGDLDQRVVEQEGQAHLLSGRQAHLKGGKTDRMMMMVTKMVLLSVNPDVFHEPRYLSDPASIGRVVGAFYCDFITLEFKDMSQRYSVLDKQYHTTIRHRYMWQLGSTCLMVLMFPKRTVCCSSKL